MSINSRFGQIRANISGTWRVSRRHSDNCRSALLCFRGNALCICYIVRSTYVHLHCRGNTLLRFRGSSGYANAPLYCVTRTLSSSSPSPPPPPQCSSPSQLFFNSPVFNFVSSYIYLYAVPPSVFGRPRSEVLWRL